METGAGLDGLARRQEKAEVIHSPLRPPFCAFRMPTFEGTEET